MAQIGAPAYLLFMYDGFFFDAAGRPILTEDGRVSYRVTFDAKGKQAARRALWIGLALLASGCMGKADAKMADDATARFYQEVAGKQYQAIYDQAAPELRIASSPDAFIGMMQRIDGAMGACQPPVKRLYLRTNASPGVFFREQGYKRTCANGALQESVTIVLRNGEAKLAGYNVQSPALPPS